MNREENSVTGGCYCGDVRYSATSRPFNRSNCHCENCRRAIGAQSVAWITVKRSDFRFDKGTPTRYHAETDAWRTFCPRCGTSLTYEHPESPEEIDITTGSVDQATNLAPMRDSFPEEKLPWVDLVRQTDTRG
jgi:hypothetical protein